MNALNHERPDRNTLAAQIAEHLAGWRAEPCDGPWLAYLVHTDGPKLALRHNDGRVKIMGTWPIGAKGQHFYPYNQSADISCAINRGAPAIAKEIGRRLLPAYLPLWQEQDRKRQEAEHSDREAEALVRRLEDLFGLGHRDHSRNGRNDAMHVYFNRASFTVYRYGSCKVDISTDDPDAVLRLAELVKTFKAED
jgi:hypothetical protein